MVCSLHKVFLRRPG